MNGFDISKYETEEEKVDAFLDYLRKSYKPETKNRKEIMNIQRARYVTSVYCVTKQMLSDNPNINVRCEIYSEMFDNDIAAIVISGNDIYAEDAGWYKFLAEHAEDISIDIDIHKNINITFGFSGMITLLEE